MENPYSYQITQRAADLGGGWTLHLLENGEKVGGGVFPDLEYGLVMDEGEAWVARFKPKGKLPDSLNETLHTVLSVLQVVEPIINKFPRDKAAIDFAKAMLARPPIVHDTQQIDVQAIAQTAVQLADALAKQLQVTAPAPAIPQPDLRQ